MAIRQKFVRGKKKPQQPHTQQKVKNAGKIVRVGKVMRRIGVTGVMHVSGVPTPADVVLHPETLSGTGRGTPGCPALKVKASKRPAYVVVTEGDSSGACRATIEGIEYSSLLRWIGSLGYSHHVAASVLTYWCIPSRKNTIVSQTSAGKDENREDKYGKGSSLRGEIGTPGPRAKADVLRIAKLEPDYEYESA